MLTYLFTHSLNANPEDGKFLITEPPNNPKKNREQLVELMFEEFKISRLYLANPSVLSLFSTGRTSGTVVDSGDGVTHSVPIVDGNPISHAI